MAEPQTSDRPFTCKLCKFGTALDDVVLRRPGTAEVICLRCFHKEAGGQLTVDAQWRRQWSNAVNEGGGT